MSHSFHLTVITLLLAVSDLSAATHYVSLESTNPTPPYATWATAATNIQQAVGVAAVGAEIVVANGVYVGGLVVANPLALRSVNGPEVTGIKGGGPCVSLTNGASLTGFTLTNGHATYGGGVWCASTNVYLTNCVIAGNSVARPSGALGGGVYQGTLYDCRLSRNRAWAYEGSGAGGGAYGSTLYNCTLTGNEASALWGGYGGGAEWCTLYNCTLTGNSAGGGGGAYGSTLYNCTLTGNSASYGGGGEGGGAYRGTLYNCTLTGNSARYDGGGAYYSTLYNCIVYFNTAPSGANYSGGALNYCCTTPLPPGAGNISADPRLTDPTHVSSDSPCVGAGSPNYTSGTDIDSEAWANPPSIGCDEFHAGPVTGPLTVTLAADYTNAAAGFALHFTAEINGHAFVNFWDFDDGTFAINEAYGLSHSFGTPGDYTVTLWACNDSYPAGVGASLVIHVDSGLHYVSASSQNPLAPYASWATAATNIQEAVDAAGVGGIVLVTNGVYAGGVEVDKPVTLRSIYGPQLTIIGGGGTNRCASLTNGASLTGFTLMNGVDSASGGGVWCASTDAFLTNCVIVGNFVGGWGPCEGGGVCRGTLYNCTLSGNSAVVYDTGWGGAADGGGAYGSTLYNCTLTGNLARRWGGGASSSTLYNCTLTDNWGLDGGAADNCTLNNSIVYSNTAGSGGANYGSYCTLNYCCTTPQPTNGVGNITNAPLFLNYAGGNLRLQSNSPCLNAGNNAYAPPGPDLDGNPRIVSGTVDIGAYEYQGPGSLISYTWLQHYGLPTDGSADFAHADADGMNNWQEWVCGTCPTNEVSALRLLSASPTGTNVTVSWQSVPGVTYFLERSANLGSPFTPLATNILGQATSISYADTNAAGVGPFFYRVGVRCP
jgi:hypothetical protein